MNNNAFNKIEKSGLAGVSQYAINKYGFNHKDSSYLKGGKQYVVTKSKDGTKNHYKKTLRGDYEIVKTEEFPNNIKVTTNYRGANITHQTEGDQVRTKTQTEVMGANNLKRFSNYENNIENSTLKNNIPELQSSNLSKKNHIDVYKKNEQGDSFLKKTTNEQGETTHYKKDGSGTITRKDYANGHSITSQIDSMSKNLDNDQSAKSIVNTLGNEKEPTSIQKTPIHTSEIIRQKSIDNVKNQIDSVSKNLESLADTSENRTAKEDLEKEKHVLKGKLQALVEIRNQKDENKSDSTEMKDQQSVDNKNVKSEQKGDTKDESNKVDSSEKDISGNNKSETFEKEKFPYEVNHEDEKIAQEMESEIQNQYRAQASVDTLQGKHQTPMESWIERNDDNAVMEVKKDAKEIHDNVSAIDKALAAIDALNKKNSESPEQKVDILEQKLAEQEKTASPFMKKMGLFGRHLAKLKEGKNGKTWYGKIVDWQNKGGKYEKLGKKVLVGAGIAAVVGGIGGVAGAGIGAAMATQRILASAAAGAGASFLHKKMTQKGLEKDLSSYKNLRNKELSNKKSQLDDVNIRLSGDELKKLRSLRQQNKESGEKSEELEKLEKKYEKLNKERKVLFSKTRSNYKELVQRREFKNDSRNKLVAAGAGLLTGLGMRYGEDILDLINQQENVTSPVDVEKTDPSISKEKIDPSISKEKIPSPISSDAFINKDEGITHALKRQLESNPNIAEKLGVLNGKPTGSDLARIAKEFGYINDDGSDVRVLMGKGAAYELTLDDAGNPIVREHFGGQVTGETYTGETTKEIHTRGTKFEGANHEGIGKGSGEYEYLSNGQSQSGSQSSSFSSNTYQGVNPNMQSSGLSQTVDTQATNTLNNLGKIRDYPNNLGGTGMQVDGRFGSRYGNMITDRYTVKLFDSEGINLNQNTLWDLGYRPGGNGKFINENTGNTLYTWKDIYEQTDFDALELQHPELFTKNAGFNLDTASTVNNPAEPAYKKSTLNNGPIRQPFTQSTGHFEIIHDERGDIHIQSDSEFRFKGEMETGDFRNREIRLLEKNKFSVLEGVPIRMQKNIPELEGTAIIKLKNGQYAFAASAGSYTDPSNPGLAEARLETAMKKLGMPNHSEYSVANPELRGGVYGSRAFTPISDEQAKYIGKIYSEINRYTGENNPKL